jgi:predicted Zn-dependent peptidase
MAVIVVGDFDPAVVEKGITAHFARFDDTRQPSPDYKVPDRPGTRYAVTTDKEYHHTVGVFNWMAARSDDVGRHRQQMVERLFVRII